MITFTKRNTILLSLFAVLFFLTSAIAGAVYFYPEKVQSYRVASNTYLSSAVVMTDFDVGVADVYSGWEQSWNNWENPIKPMEWFNTAYHNAHSNISRKYQAVTDSVNVKIAYVKSIPESIQLPSLPKVSLSDWVPFYDENSTFSLLDLANIETAAGGQKIASLDPAEGDLDDTLISDDVPPQNIPQIEGLLFDRYDEPVVTAEAVLVPRAKTVISSSRDGKIAKINFDNGDHFKKGDILLEYKCAAVKYEIDAAVTQSRFARERKQVVTKLYDMDLASRLETLEAQAESKKAAATKVMTESQNDDCIIRADYDGRVVKRLANPGEYTRTDRVLIEVASKGTLDVEFLLPSMWLRWVNIDAPFQLKLHETGATYNGTIKRIFGEVDPVSQSIQIRAGLNDYDHPLLPGMSGQISLDIRDIRSAGVRGYLDVQQ